MKQRIGSLVAIVACLGETTEGIAAAVLLLPVAVGEVSYYRSFYYFWKMQPGMTSMYINSNPDFRFCLTGIQILSLRFSKCRFVYDLNRYF